MGYSKESTIVIVQHNIFARSKLNLSKNLSLKAFFELKTSKVDPIDWLNHMNLFNVQKVGKPSAYERLIEMNWLN